MTSMPIWHSSHLTGPRPKTGRQCESAKGAIQDIQPEPSEPHPRPQGGGRLKPSAVAFQRGRMVCSLASSRQRGSSDANADPRGAAGPDNSVHLGGVPDIGLRRLLALPALAQATSSVTRSAGAHIRASLVEAIADAAVESQDSEGHEAAKKAAASQFLTCKAPTAREQLLARGADRLARPSAWVPVWKSAPAERRSKR